MEEINDLSKNSILRRYRKEHWDLIESGIKKIGYKLSKPSIIGYGGFGAVLLIESSSRENLALKVILIPEIDSIEEKKSFISSLSKEVTQECISR